MSSEEITDGLVYRERIVKRLCQRIAEIAELENAAGVTREFGVGAVTKLQAKRHATEDALNIVVEAFNEVDQ